MNTEYLEQLKEAHDCPVCGWDAATINTKVHRKRCAAWQQACQIINYTPMTRPVAEEAIDQARTQVKAASTDQEKVDAWITLLQALFERSLAMAIAEGAAPEHPDFGQYASMVSLAEMPDAIRTRFGHEPEHIAPGFTIWQPPNSRMRRTQFRNAKRRQDNHA